MSWLSRFLGRTPPRRRELCDRREMSDATLRRQVRDYSRGMRQKIGIIQSLQQQFPSQYRELLEQYYRQLSKDAAAP